MRSALIVCGMRTMHTCCTQVPHGRYNNHECCRNVSKGQQHAFSLTAACSAGAHIHGAERSSGRVIQCQLFSRG
jgi:hypothetical protein